MSSVGMELLQTVACLIVAVILVCVSSTFGIRCEDMSIGVEAKGIIPDSSFTASNFYNANYRPYFARLLSSRSGWCPSNPQSDKNYLQIDFGFEYFVCTIATKAGTTREYVKTYTVTMSVDKQNWASYKEDGKVKILQANSDGSNVKKSLLKKKPLMRHIRLYPVDYHRYKAIKIAVFGYAKFQVCISNPLGMQSGKIPDGRISASTSQPSTSNARLQSASSWCPTSVDSDPYLQVDLGSDHVICAIATQGNDIADQWVKSYHIWISSSESSLTPYKVNNVTRTFYGNYDGSAIVRQVLYDSPTARYLRIVPKTHHVSTCLRLEVYGYELEPTCSKHSVGVPSPLIMPNHRFTASSWYSSTYEPHRARLEGTSNSWMARTRNNEYLQIDLGQVFLICAILTQGDSSRSYWVREYKLKYSRDNILWEMYKDQNGNEKVLKGNSDRSTIVTHSIKPSFKAKFIRVVVPGYGRNWISLRVDFKGTAEACTYPLGIENKRIPDSQLTSSSSLDSSHRASRGRLYGGYSWCSSASSNAEYIQVDLGRVKTVTGVATQGDRSSNKWVTSYHLSYSYSAEIWYEYREDKVPKIFTGNTNRNDVIVNWLHRPIAARYVRILPQTNSGGNCIRFDLYGCDHAISPKAWITKNEITLQSSKGSYQILTCAVVGEPLPTVQWFRNDTTIIQGATQLSLPVHFVSAQQIVSTYKCERKDPMIRAVICKMNYTCVVTYPEEVPSTGQAEATARVTVNLNVPAKQMFTVSRGERFLNLTWTPVQSDDVGSITWFAIRLDGKECRVPTGNTWYSFIRLLPYTNYTLQMRAASVVGEGVWSDVQTVATLIAEPEVVPSSVSGKSTSSTSIEVSWALHTSAKVNGPLRGFRITYTDKYGRNTLQQGGNIRKSALTQLKKWTEYKITVSVWNSLYYGPESTAMSVKTHQDAPECPLRLNSAKALSSTSVRVIWDPLPNSPCRNGVLKGYKILLRQGGGHYQMAGKVGSNINSKDIGSLEKFQTYVFAVVAYTVKDGVASNGLTTKTLQDAPSEPMIKETKLIPPKGPFRVPRAQITWDKPSNENGIIKGYTLVYSYYGSHDVSSNEVYVNISDTSSLAHIMDVVGEAQLWLKLSASTIKEGPYSSLENLAVPAYAPSISPQAVRVTKHNETTFKIAWQPLPRHKSNGVVKTYRITWIISHIGRTKRMAIGDTFKGTTQGTHFVLHSLRLCAQYEVRIAAATIAGSGPNATLKITTSQPGEPSNVVSQEISKRFVTLRWQKPIGMVEDVKNYKVYYKGSKPYWPAYSSPLKDKSRDGNQLTLKIDDLQPGTLYEFWIVASTVCGESNKSLTVKAETEVDKPYPTQDRAPIDLKDSFNITLWTFKPYNGPISLYQVIVVHGNKNINEIPQDVRNYQMSKKNNEPYYITAELTPEDLDSLKTSAIFVIGDNKMYRGYKNVALEKGLVYAIAQRVITIYKGKTYTSDPVHVATIQLSAESTNNAAKSQKNSAMGVAIGVVVPLLIIMVILALLALRYKRSHSANKDRCMAVPLDKVSNELEDNDLISNGNDAATAGSINRGRAQYANFEAVASSSEGIYENDSSRDNARTPMTKRQFLEYMKSLKPTAYAELKTEFKMLLNTHVFPVDIAKLPANKKKNRYANIVTYDHSRVEISRKLDDENSDYINASYVKGYDGVTKTYIATQGPTAVTVADFWQMIWEQNSYTIVMLTNLKEGSKVKCDQYWPGDKETHRDITVTIHKTEVFPDYVRRTLLLAKSTSNEHRQVNHFQFTVWPDKGVPQYSTAVLGLRRKVKAVNPDHAGPLVVHCSAGVGRTGAYIVIDAMLDRARYLKNLSISEYVAAIRNDRPYMVQTDEQYVFIHLALFEAFTCGNTEIPAFNLQATMKKLSGDVATPKKSTGYTVEYERLNRVTEDYALEACDIGRSPENAHKNRYQQCVALNRSRVLLGKSGEDVTTSYINASHVDAYTQRNAFLVTQAPLENTIEDFWIMVVNYDVQTIVMLNNLHEGKEHFIQYWPEVGSTSYGYVGVELRDVTSIGQLTCRYLNVTYDSTTVQVQHIQIPNWENKSCPANPQSVLDLMNEVEQSQRHAQSSSSPIVVQCSNGTGRCGTFCAIYSMLERVKEEQIVDVFQAVKRIRANRPGAVETLAQYVFCYEIIESYLDSFSDYANFAK